MEGQRLILNDGTTIEDGMAGYSEGCLWLRLPGYTMQQAALIVFDPTKTSRITFQYGDFEDVYVDFTDCVNISVNFDGLVSACMKKGAVS